MRYICSTLLAACLLCGCATERPTETSAPPITTAPRISTSPPITSARPMQPESIGLFLETEARKGPYGAPFTTMCNVNLRTLHNTSIPIWKFPRVMFYAEQNGEFFALRRIETHSGGISRPYSLAGLSVTLPRPPRSGHWRIFAIQEHSELVYSRHRESQPEKFPLVHVEDQNEARGGMWTTPIVSNSIVVEFAELDDGKVRSAERVIQSLIDAGQYDSDFREPSDDPVMQSVREDEPEQGDATLFDADAFLRAQMLNRWSSPERRKWKIEHRPIDGMEGAESWHVQGTQFWVRIHPEVYLLSELNRDSVYELDAIALNQNYSVIDFYLYTYPRELERVRGDSAAESQE